MKTSARHTDNSSSFTTCRTAADRPGHDEADDFALMVRIQRQDPMALAELFQRYRMLLKSVILRVVHSHASADDVMQQCMLEIWHHAANYSAQKGTPLGWIVTLAKRRAIDHLRRQQTYANARERLQDSTWQNAEENRAPDAAADCEQADLGRVLNQQITRLPTPQQQVIRLAFIHGMSQREVAQATHTPLGTVKTRMELGLKKLRHAFRSIGPRGFTTPSLRSA
jgi:RNA polymerase sigma-70 factor (ECF subfamily)